ncbi:hypothetical protein [Pectobacterium aroidearum]|uniref:hypothetical protein n=1 Tax=Pectobacterium aroidearum TaxID=1201031 RepID=UPI001CD53F8D|nr:hypothetical protein [Pectobacterium aroidearum]
MTDLLSKERLKELSTMHGADCEILEEAIKETAAMARELLQRREAAEKPVFSIEVSGSHWLNCSEGKLTPEAGADFTEWPNGVCRLYLEPPLTSAERERLAAYDRAAKEAAGYQYRIRFYDGEWSAWKECGRVMYEGILTEGNDKCVGREMERRLLFTAPPLPVVPEGLHQDTAKLVVDFATALAEKLYKSQMKYGYDADWKSDGWTSQCQAHFHQHIAKGDPRDVSAYCAFMWYHGWKTEAQTPPVVPDEKWINPDIHYADENRFAEGWNACRAAMIDAAPQLERKDGDA